MAYWISPLTSCAWANESGLARVHEVNTTFFSTRATRMWCLTCSGWCHIFAHGPTAEFSHSDHSGITGKNKFAFYVELAFVTSSPRNRFILLVKRKKIRLHWKFSEQIHYHMAQNYITMTCKILKSASAMRKTSHYHGSKIFSSLLVSGTVSEITAEIIFIRIQFQKARKSAEQWDLGMKSFQWLKGKTFLKQYSLPESLCPFHPPLSHRLLSPVSWVYHLSGNQLCCLFFLLVSGILTLYQECIPWRILWILFRKKSLAYER